MYAVVWLGVVTSFVGAGDVWWPASIWRRTSCKSRWHCARLSARLGGWLWTGCKDLTSFCRSETRLVSASTDWTSWSAGNFVVFSRAWRREVRLFMDCVFGPITVVASVRSVSRACFWERRFSIRCSILSNWPSDCRNVLIVSSYVLFSRSKCPAWGKADTLICRLSKRVFAR